MDEKKGKRPRLIQYVDYVVRIWGGIVIGAMTFVVLLQVVARFVFNRPLPWPEEVAQWLLVGCAYIGSTLIENRGLYIRVELIDYYLSKKKALVLSIFGRLLLLGVLMFFLNGERLQYSHLRLNESPGGGIPLLWLHIPLMLGLVLWMVCIIVYLMENLRKLRGIHDLG